MTRFMKTTMALAASSLLAAAAPNMAQADVMASAVLVTSNFKVLKSDNSTVADFINDFDYISFTTTGGYAGTYPGTPGFNSSVSSGATKFPNGSTSGTLSAIDLPNVCVGGGCGVWNAAYGADNSFTLLTQTAVGNYAAADQVDSGAPITGIPATGGGTVPVGALTGNAAYAAMTTDSGLSHSTSTNNLNSLFTFSPGQGGVFYFDFDIQAYLQVLVTADEIAPGFATASFQNDLTLTDESNGGAVVFSASPDLMSFIGFPGKTISLNAQLPVDIEKIRNSGVLHFNFATPSLQADHLYQLSVRSNVNADVQRELPEPATLVLLGIGLAGFGFLNRRRG